MKMDQNWREPSYSLSFQLIFQKGTFPQGQIEVNQKIIKGAVINSYGGGAPLQNVKK